MTSFTKVITDTYTDSKAEYVMGKIYSDFQSIHSRGFDYLKNHPELLSELKKILFYIISQKALKSFQIQFIHSSGDRAIEYEVKADGSIYADNNSGGIDYWQIPKDSIFNVIVDLIENIEVWNELQKLGWTRGGTYVTGNVTDKGAYSKNGYGTTKKLIGPWDK